MSFEKVALLKPAVIPCEFCKIQPFQNSIGVDSDNLDYPQFKKWLNKAVGAEGEDLSKHDKWLCIVIMNIEY